MSLKSVRLLFVILSSICLINPLSTFAQSSSPTDSLFSRLQNYTDSSLVLEYTSNWMSPTSLYILSKKGDTLNAFTYKNRVAHRDIGKIIKGVRIKMLYTDIFKMLRVKPDINDFFNFYPLSESDIHKFWTKLSEVKPWFLTDDAVNGHGCPPSKPEITQSGDTIIRNHAISDGGGIRLYLITRNQIKVLDYYAPDFYINVCPGRKDRENILRIAKIFKEYIL